MKTRGAVRIGLAALSVLATSACAHATGSIQDAGYMRDSLSGSCLVRVESEYDEPIETGARAGKREVALGTVAPGEALEFTVPCTHRAVTVFRLVRIGGQGADVRLGERSRALHPDGVTVFSLGPSVGRRPAAARDHQSPA